jgi:hypothetical protein
MYRSPDVGGLNLARQPAYQIRHPAELVRLMKHREPIRLTVSCVCTTSEDARERVTHLGGITPRGEAWRLSEAHVVEGLRRRLLELTVQTPDGAASRIEIAWNGRLGTYLRSAADADDAASLVSLQRCPTRVDALQRRPRATRELSRDAALR